MTKFRRAILAAFVAIGFVGVSCGADAGYLQVAGSFHPLTGGQFYRSTPPVAENLASDVQDHGIDTAINLRGAHPGAPWHDKEVKSSMELGLTNIGFGMLSSKLIPSVQAEYLVELVGTGSEPILIHCQSSADRGGFAPAFFVRRIADVDEANTKGQPSFYSGHVGTSVISAAYAMDHGWKVIEAKDRRQAQVEFAGDHRSITQLATSPVA